MSGLVELPVDLLCKVWILSSQESPYVTLGVFSKATIR